MAREFHIRQDLQRLGLPERTIRVLEKAAQIVDLLNGQTSLDDDLTDTALLAILTEARVDDLEAFEADGPYVEQDQTPAWTDATGTAARTALASYAGQTVSNPPTQAEMQALDDAVKAISQHLVAFINDARANGTLT
jgi:hypothetical protein